VCRILRWLARQQVREVVLNLHHRPETITSVVGDGTTLGVRVRYSWEHPLLGSAGGPRRALQLLDAGRFWLVNGDTLHTLDLAALAETHRRTGALVTMAVVPNPCPDRYGGVMVEGGFIRGFVPPGTAGPSHHFVGVQLVEADVFAGLPDGEPAESVSGVYRALLEQGRSPIAACVLDVPFMDVGTPSDYLTTALAVARQEGFGEVVPSGRGCRVHPSARIVRTVLWDDVTIEGGVQLSECIVTDGVTIPTGVNLQRRIVMRASGVESSPVERMTGLVVTDLSEGVR